MRKRIKPAASWPFNGAACPARQHSSIASVTLPTLRCRFFSNRCQLRQVALFAKFHGGHTNVMSSRASSLAIFRQVWKHNAARKRDFRTFMPRRSDDGLDDGLDDYDDINFASSTMSAMVRDRGEPLKQAAEAARRKREEQTQLNWYKRRQELSVRVENFSREMAQMLADQKQHDEERRLAREKRQQALKEWTRLFNEVVERAFSFTGIEDRLFEELYSLKYPSSVAAEKYLDEMTSIIDSYRAELSKLRQTFREIKLASRRIELDKELGQFAGFLASVANSLSETLTPQASAKININKILDPVANFQRLYANLQDTGAKLDNRALEIYENLMGLIALPSLPAKRKQFYKLWLEKVRTLQRGLSFDLHNYRVNKRVASWSNPLGQSQVFTFAISQSREANAIREVVVQAKSYGHFDSAVMYLSHWYLRRWDGHHPRSANHNISWKHLNVVHPFDILYTTYRVLTIQVEEFLLIYHLNGGDLERCRKLDLWVRTAKVMGSNLQSDINIFKYHVWLRLRTESRACSLGIVPDTMLRGLFTPSKPLSSDPRRFFLYVDSIRDYITSIRSFSQSITRLRGKSRYSMIRSGSSAIAHIKVHDVPEQLTASKRQPKISTFKSLTPQTSSSLAPIKSSVLKEQNFEKKHLRHRDGRVRRAAQISTAKLATKSSRPSRKSLAGPLKRGLYSRSSGSSLNFTRRYSQTSYALWSGQQSQVAQENVASNGDQPQTTSLQLTGTRAGDTIVTTVSGKQVSKKVSSHLSVGEPEEFGEYPTPGFDHTSPQFWSYSQQKRPDGGNIIVHYCKTLDSAERIAKLFLENEVVGFDIEWKAQALSTSRIKDNVSLIQIASAERIALFHLAMFRPGNQVHELVPPSLKKVLESANTVKVGVSIKADSSRVRRHLGIDIRSQLELSHLYKLVKYSQTQPKMVNRRTVNLSQQVEELMGLPLRKDNDVRRSDWTRPLDYNQVQYAASDAYACICLHRILNAKRKALSPVPPMPAYAELGLPILLATNDNKDGE